MCLAWSQNSFAWTIKRKSMFTLSFRAKHDLVHLITRSWFIFRFIMARPCAITYFFCVYKLLSSQHKRTYTQIQLNYSFGRYAVSFLYIQLRAIEYSIVSTWLLLFSQLLLFFFWMYNSWKHNLRCKRQIIKLSFRTKK